MLYELRRHTIDLLAVIDGGRRPAMSALHRIAELERITRDLRQDIRELSGLLEAAERRVSKLEKVLSVATDRIAVLERGERRIWTHISNRPGGI
jgi:chromosome segregation ATPase